MERRTALAALAIFAVGLACESSTDPVEPVWGKHSCRHCRMVVSDPRYAAQLVTADGDRAFFDDVGCMVEQLERQKPARAWVRSESGAWIDVAAARFRDGASTPMDSGFAPASGGAFDLAAVRRSLRERRQESRR